MKEKIITFVTEVVKEMQKVTWPKRNELYETTSITIAVCLVIAAFIYGIDTIVSQLLKFIL